MTSILKRLHIGGRNNKRGKTKPERVQQGSSRFLVGNSETNNGESSLAHGSTTTTTTKPLQETLKDEDEGDDDDHHHHRHNHDHHPNVPETHPLQEQSPQRHDKHSSSKRHGLLFHRKSRKEISSTTTSNNSAHLKLSSATLKRRHRLAEQQHPHDGSNRMDPSTSMTLSSSNHNTSVSSSSSLSPLKFKQNHHSHHPRMPSFRRGSSKTNIRNDTMPTTPATTVSSTDEYDTMGLLPHHPLSDPGGIQTELFQEEQQQHSGNQHKARITTRTTTTTTTTNSINNNSNHHHIPNSSSSTTSNSTNLSRKQLNKEAERIARAAAALDSKGNDLFEKGYYDKAMETYTKALKLKRRTFHSMLEEVDDLMAESLEDDPDVIQKTDHRLLVSMATSINNIGYLRQRAGDATPDETMAAYKKSLRIKRQILGNDSLSVGKTLNNIGSVHYLKQEFPGALMAYEEALQIMQSALGPEHPDVATVFSNMGDVYWAQGDKPKALEHYRNALTIRWGCFGEHDPKVVRLLEKIAAIEMGDTMMEQTRLQLLESGTLYYGEESELFDLDMKPMAQELHLLHGQLEEDLQYVDWMSKKMAMDMIKDKVLIMRGMRELMEECNREEASVAAVAAAAVASKRPDNSHREDSERTDDDQISLTLSPIPQKRYLSSSVPKQSPVVQKQDTNGIGTDRDQALKNVKERLARIREQRSASNVNKNSGKDGNDSSSSLNLTENCHASSSSLFGASFYTAPRDRRPNLSKLEADELKGGVETLRSALVLKRGIESLRSFNLGDDIDEEEVQKARDTET